MLRAEILAEGVSDELPQPFVRAENGVQEATLRQWSSQRLDKINEWRNLWAR